MAAKTFVFLYFSVYIWSMEAVNHQNNTTQPQRIIGVPWQPGQTGNPNGRPKVSKTIPDILRKIGDLPAPEKFIAKLRESIPALVTAFGKELTFQQAVHARVYLDAINGDEAAREYIANRTEGKPVQDINTHQTGPVQIIVGNEETAKNLSAAISAITGSNATTDN